MATLHQLATMFDKNLSRQPKYFAISLNYKYFAREKISQTPTTFNPIPTNIFLITVEIMKIKLLL